MAIRCVTLWALFFVVCLTLGFMFIAEQWTLWFAVGLGQHKMMIRKWVSPQLMHLVGGEISNNEQFQFSAQSHSPFGFKLYGVVPNVLCTTPRRMTRGTIPDNLVREINGQAETSILFEFSPLINDHVRSMFAKHVTMEKWFAIYPFQVSCLPNKSRLFCAVRVWLRLDRFQAFTNRYQDSFLYVLELDSNLRYIPDSGHLVSIPSPIQDIHYTGPEDPRLIMIDDSIVVNFINGHIYPGLPGTKRRQFLWSLDKNFLVDMEANGFIMNAMEKNWSPWVVNNTLLFVYQLLPVTRVLHCPFHYRGDRRTANCSFVTGRPVSGIIDTGSLLLRGGSPFVHYQGDYYIAITHAVQRAYTGRLYTAQLTLINGPAARVVFVSSPIVLDQKLMRSIESTDQSIVRPFFYARSLFVEDENNLVVAGGVNDNRCFLARIRGVASILSEAMANDRNLVADSRMPTCQLDILNERLYYSYTTMEKWIREKSLVESDNFYFNRRP